MPLNATIFSSFTNLKVLIAFGAGLSPLPRPWDRKCRVVYDKIVDSTPEAMLTDPEAVVEDLTCSYRSFRFKVIKFKIINSKFCKIEKYSKLVTKNLIPKLVSGPQNVKVCFHVFSRIELLLRINLFELSVMFFRFAEAIAGR